MGHAGPPAGLPTQPPAWPRGAGAAPSHRAVAPCAGSTLPRRGSADSRGEPGPKGAPRTGRWDRQHAAQTARPSHGQNCSPFRRPPLPRQEHEDNARWMPEESQSRQRQPPSPAPTRRALCSLNTPGEPACPQGAPDAAPGAVQSWLPFTPGARCQQPAPALGTGCVTAAASSTESSAAQPGAELCVLRSCSADQRQGRLAGQTALEGLGLAPALAWA